MPAGARRSAATSASFTSVPYVSRTTSDPSRRIEPVTGTKQPVLHQRDHLDAFPVAEGYQQGTWVGHGGEAGFRKQPDIPPVGKEPGERFHLLGRGVLVELVEFQFGDMSFEPGGRQETPGGAHFLHHKALQPGQELEDRGGEYLPGVPFSQGCGNEI